MPWNAVEKHGHEFERHVVVPEDKSARCECTLELSSYHRPGRDVRPIPGALSGLLAAACLSTTNLGWIFDDP